MQDPNDPSPTRPIRRRTAITIAAVIAVMTAGTLLTIRHDGGEPASAAPPPTPAATDAPTPTTTPPGATRRPTSVARPASMNPPAAPTAPEPEQAPEPEPLMADGRHPVFLTDIDPDGGTVEFDLLQYLTDAEQEAYEAAHPTEYAGCGCDDGGPIHNDNPRLRRLPVAPDTRVFLRGSTMGDCHTTTLAALPGEFDNGDHDYEPDAGHLGFEAFWLTVDHDTVVDIEELNCES
jgi:hypothetical protein